MKKIVILIFFMMLQHISFSQENISFSNVYKSFEVDQVATYPYGKDSLEKYLRTGIGELDVSVCHGTAMVSFIVETDGSLTGFKTIRSVCPYVDQKLIELVSKMPNWNPGRISGFPVRSEVNIPFIIKVEKIKISN